MCTGQSVSRKVTRTAGKWAWSFDGVRDGGAKVAEAEQRLGKLVPGWI